MGIQTQRAACIGVILIALYIMPTYSRNIFEDSDASQQVIFEKMGNYIGTAIYVHVHVNLPIIPFIKEIEKFIDLFTNERNILMDRLKNKKQMPTDQINFDILQSAINQLETLRKDVLQEILILPAHSRDKRQLEVFATILGVVGTIFGGFNAHQIENIKATLKDVRKRQNLLVEITQLNSKHIENLEITQKNIADILIDLITNNPTSLMAKTSEILFMAVRSATIIHDAIQQAQNHRLSTTLIDSTTLKQLFSEVISRSLKENAVMILQHPSDLFQIDCSYVHNRDGSVSLIVHVPMAKQNQVYNLYQHIPIPLSQTFSTNLTITPKVDSQYIAIGPHYEYKIMSSSDLATCTKMGDYFFCNGRDVVQTDLTGTCLGALFKREINSALKYCEFEIGEPKEKVFSVGRNDYIITAPAPFEANMICSNAPHQSVSIDRFTRITVEEGCEIQLDHNIIQPDINIKDNQTIIYKNINWNFDRLFPGQKMEDLSQKLLEIRDLGDNIVTAQQLRHLSIQDAYIPDPDQLVHSNVTLYVVLAVIAILMILFTYYCYDRIRILPQLISAHVKAVHTHSKPAPPNFKGPDFRENIQLSHQWNRNRPEPVPVTETPDTSIEDPLGEAINDPSTDPTSTAPPNSFIYPPIPHQQPPQPPNRQPSSFEG